MAIRSTRILSICSGGGGLDLGVKLALGDARTVCYVEREAFSALHLVKAMEEGFLDKAPLWSDLRTFDGRPWRGVVDWLIGGIPCQPHSVAGQGLGASDDRDLWPAAARIIEEVRPGVVFLENVEGIIRYYFNTIWPVLHKLGYRVEAGLFAASEVGASQQRKRLFVLASTDNSPDGSSAVQEPRQDSVQECARSGGGDMGNTNDAGREGRVQPAGIQGIGRSGAGSASADVAISQRRTAERRGYDMARAQSEGQEGTGEREWVRLDVGASNSKLADTEGQQWEAGFGLGRGEQEESSPSTGPVYEASIGTSGLASPSESGLQGFRRTGETEPQPSIRPLFPPYPNDSDSWTRVLQVMPEVEPAFCLMADGVASWVDTSSTRAHRLRLLGNGVVPLVAAYALRTLSSRLSENERS